MFIAGVDKWIYTDMYVQIDADTHTHTIYIIHIIIKV